MATQLSEMYVQISAKGMAEAQAEIRKLRNELAATKKPAEDMENGLGRIGSMCLSQLGPLGMLANGVRNLWALFANPPKPKIPVLPRADGIPVLNPAGKGGGAGAAMGGMSVAAMGAIGAAVAVVGMAVSHVLGLLDAMKDKLMALARAGFEGTAEMHRYEHALKLISREVAGALVPALNLLTSIMMTVQRAIASVGPTGQKVFAALLVAVLALGVAFTVLTGVIAVLIAITPLSWMMLFAGALVYVAGAIYLAWNQSKDLRDAVAGLRQQFGELLVTLEPVGVLLLKVGGILLQTFTAGPLILLIKGLTLALAIMERMAKLSLIMKLIPKDTAGAAGAKSSVTLNQTGEESGAATFQRIQQEILKMGANEETVEERQATALEGIEIWLEKRFGSSDVKNPDAPPAESIIGGAVGSGAFGIGGVIANRIFGGR